MGNGFFSEADSRRIADLATEVNGQFSKDFSVAFKDAVINKLKKAYLDGSINKNTLMQYDNPSQEIKAGFLLKIGGNVKSWKNRYFVAKNKSDNYAIVYYEDESMRKEKGRFCCCGYQVEAFSADEVNWYGVYGIKLTSYDETRRQWLFRARSDPEQSEWLEVFMNACKKAKPEPIKDPVYEETFKAAFSATKAAYGYFGVGFIFGSECEMLEHLTNQILSREILDDYIMERAKAQPAQAKGLVLEVHRHVQKIVKPIVQTSWDNCFAAVRVLKAPFELSVKASLSQLLQRESEIKAKLEPRIREIVLPHLNDIDNTICKPILDSCFEPMLQSYEQAVEGLQVELCMLVHTVEPNADAVRSAQLAIQLGVEQGCLSSTSPLADAQKSLWTMHTEDLLDLQEIFEISGLVGFDVYSNALDDLKVLTQNAIYTFGVMAMPTSSSAVASSSSQDDGKSSPSDEGSRHSSPGREEKDRTESSNSATSANTRHNASSSKRTTHGSSRSRSRSPTPSVSDGDGLGGGSNHSGSKRNKSNRHKKSSSRSGRSASVTRRELMAALNQVISRMCTDAVLWLRAGLLRLLTESMEARVQESFLAPSVDILHIAQSYVTRDMQLLINLNSIAETMIRDMVRDFILNLLSKRMMEANGRLQDLSDRLCCANPVPYEG